MVSLMYSYATNKKMDDLVEKMTECPICMEKFNDHVNVPKFLPCHHTFCCKCLETLCADFNGRFCPLCWAFFAAPQDGRCSRLPDNAFVKELVRVNGAQMNLKIMQTDLARVSAELEESRNAQQKATDEKNRLINALRECSAKLAQEKPRLESRVKELETDLSAVRSTESRLREEQREIAEKLEDAEHKVETAKTELETSQRVIKELEKDRSAARSTESRLRAEQREIAEKLKDAEHKAETAKTELETSQRVIKDTKASLRESERSGQNLKHENDRLKVELKRTRHAKGRPFSYAHMTHYCS